MEDNIIIREFPPIRKLAQRYKGMRVVDVGGRGEKRPSFVLNNGIRITYGCDPGRYRPPSGTRPDRTRRSRRLLPYWRATHVRHARGGFYPASRTIYVSAPTVMLAMHKAIQVLGVSETAIELRRV